MSLFRTIFAFGKTDGRRALFGLVSLKSLRHAFVVPSFWVRFRRRKKGGGRHKAQRPHHEQTSIATRRFVEVPKSLMGTYRKNKTNTIKARVGRYSNKTRKT